MDIKDIFPYEEPIKLSDDINKQLDIRRQKYEADRTLLEKDIVEIDIENIVELQNGRLKTHVDGVEFECFFHRGEGRKLYIVLEAARRGTRVRNRLARWSWYTFSDYSWLVITDPTYSDNEDVEVGWFYGTAEKNYRKYVAHIADKISDYLCIEKDNVCFYGSSAGGTAAIHSAAIFGHGTAVSINGQINFEYDHKDVINYIKCTGIDLHQADKWNRNALCKVMSEAKDVIFILLENSCSSWDINDHLLYLCNILKCPPPEYGISQFGNITTWIYDAPANIQRNAHICFENKNIFYAIDFLTGLVRGNEDVEKYKPLYLLFNEFWHDIYYPTIKFHVQDKESLSIEELIDKLIWNRRRKAVADYKLKKISEIINSDITWREVD